MANTAQTPEQWLDREIELSFPASDPPSFMGSVLIAGCVHAPPLRPGNGDAASLSTSDKRHQ